LGATGLIGECEMALLAALINGT